MPSGNHLQGKVLNGSSFPGGCLGMTVSGNALSISPSPRIRGYLAELQSTCALFRQLLSIWKRFSTITPWPIYSDIKDVEALTPSHLLYGRWITSVPHPLVRAMKWEIPLINQTQISSDFLALLIQQFCQRWRHEYLISLESFTKDPESTPNPWRLVI